jgi:hypothetical protein
MAYKIIGNSGVRIGTCSINQNYGQVISADYDRSVDTQDIKGCDGGVIAILLQNEKITAKFEVIFDESLPLPEIGDVMQFPDFDVAGTILKVGKKLSQSSQTTLSIEATHWVSIGSGTRATPTSLWTGPTITEVA